MEGRGHGGHGAAGDQAELRQQDEGVRGEVAQAGGWSTGGQAEPDQIQQFCQREAGSQLNDQSQLSI